VHSTQYDLDKLINGEGGDVGGGGGEKCIPSRAFKTVMTTQGCITT
jgi:hypothetical protein